MRAFLFFISISIFGLSASADGLLCADLFSPSYGINEFIISVSGKKQSDKFLKQAHMNVMSDYNSGTLRLILKTMKESGLADLTAEQKTFIIKFRQNTSFLRSIFQTSEDQHESPKHFANFVRDFGVLKDFLLMEDSKNLQQMAQKILKKYSELDFDGLLLEATPASKKSVKKYFLTILSETKHIMNQQIMTVDQVHDVRKNLRDVLRYMQIQHEVQLAGKDELRGFNFTPADAVQNNMQIQFLKKINAKLGEICDDNAAKILNGELTEDAIVEFPVNIRPRVEYFLDHYQIIFEPQS